MIQDSNQTIVVLDPTAGLAMIELIQNLATTTAARKIIKHQPDH
jgi:hypothetical protein